MTDETKSLLKAWAARYHTSAFILNDPVQFPHRYKHKQDIEICGLLTAILSFGNRKMIVRKAEELDSFMRPSPYQYLLSRKWLSDFPLGNKSSKKLNMFLRWMVRRDSEVDFGLWTSFSPRDLTIPLDTHVCRLAYMLGLTDSDSFSLRNARKITNALAEVFPGDPCLGDFALFGYGINHAG